MRNLIIRIGMYLAAAVIGLSYAKMYELMYPPPAPVIAAKTPYLHVVKVNTGVLDYVINRHELAFIIAHEIAHLELEHTQTPKQSVDFEYNADQLAVYYMLRAGYHPCAAAQLWQRRAKDYIRIVANSHPLPETRAKYMTFEFCRGYNIKEEIVDGEDAETIFNNLLLHVKVKIRMKSMFMLRPNDSFNASAITIMH